MLSLTVSGLSLKLSQGSRVRPRSVWDIRQYWATLPFASALLRDFPDIATGVNETGGSYTPGTIHRAVQEFYST